MHDRLEPVRHRFRFPVYFYAFDLDELEQLDKQNLMFGYNRIRPVAIHDKDYFYHGADSIRQKVLSYLKEKPYYDDIARIEFITAARFMHYVFNPVSFYYCYNKDDEILANIAEVNNTFGERHPYILDKESVRKPGYARHYLAKREFHVSPFNDMRGDYDFHFSEVNGKVNIKLDILRDKRVVFRSGIYGKSLPFTQKNLIKTIARYPLSAALTTPRIMWEAAKLYYRKKLPVHTKPIPMTSATLQVKRPSIWQSCCIRLFDSFLKNVRCGQLTLRMPNGERVTYGDPASGTLAYLEVRDYAFFPKLLLGGDVAFGETYLSGMWETSDLTKLLVFFVENDHIFREGNIPLSALGRFLNRLYHRSNKNSISGSRSNISAHYNLSNDMFKLFLDDSMTYSSGIYQNDSDSLSQAQQNKLDAIIKKAKIQSHHHVLEIGTGWGSLAIKMAQQTGCRVTSVTISEQQRELAIERIEEAGLSDRINVELCDYRQIRGSYDRIVSVEMLEAVGHQFLGQYFQRLNELLAPNGIVVLQVITLPDARYDEYLKSCDWIQKHIFPGSNIPSLSALQNAMTNNSQLYIENLENIGIHYARTLREWHERFVGAHEKIRALGFGREFERAWRYYFAYCEAGFATRTINNLQLVLTRQFNQDLGLGYDAAA